MKFYTYSQNNSGGSFTDPARFVIIEAYNQEEAEGFAKDLGVYFDGCDDGTDCECCGDRWSRYCGEASDKPLIYDSPPDEYAASKDNMFRGETATFLIRSYDGTIRKGE